MADALFKELPLRALGYGFAVGEALVYVASSRKIDICYTIGACFIGSHCIYSLVAPDGSPAVSLLRAVLWEGLASYLFPTLIVYHASRLTFTLLDETKLPSGTKRWVPCLLGLAITPFLMQPLDELCDNMVSSLVG
ncbi:mitochondrial fission process protein 1 [Aplysia californica]|uniref:Mitochondrial fission process protein 1 n=1 Tax=Aplysia californica TaxID=6500 RepID=A0ABM0ZU83_APLCA|nr:mitochondrial fission process protein 1 [Aplysia californica]